MHVSHSCLLHESSTWHIGASCENKAVTDCRQHRRRCMKNHSPGIMHQFKKKVIEKWTCFSQPTRGLVTKHRIHCAMVAMATRAIYLGMREHWCSGQAVVTRCWALSSYYFREHIFWPLLNTQPMTLMTHWHLALNIPLLLCCDC